MLHIAKHVKPAEMRGPEAVLLIFGLVKRDRCAGHIAGFLGQGDHIGDQHIIPPRIVAVTKLVDHRPQLARVRHNRARRISLDMDHADIEQMRGFGDGIDRIHQLPRHGITRCQSKQLAFIGLNKLAQYPARGRELRL